jgi:hypothetical protein
MLGVPVNEDGEIKTRSHDRKKIVQVTNFESLILILSREDPNLVRYKNEGPRSPGTIAE